MRHSRKLRNLNVWQQGIDQHRASRQRGSASVSRPAAAGGWAKAFFRRLLGRRSAGGRAVAETAGAAAAGISRPGSAQQLPPTAKSADLALSEGMLSRRPVTATGQSAAPPRIARAEEINVRGCRDLRLWNRGKEFVAAALGGFDPGAGAEHAAQRRALWRQRSQRRALVARAGAASKAAQSLRLLLRAVAARPARDEVGHAAVGTPAGTVVIADRPRRASNRPAPQPVAVAAAAGTRRGRSFRDHKFRQQGFRMLEKALRARKQA
jgi:hypothetical protein